MICRTGFKHSYIFIVESCSVASDAIQSVEFSRTLEWVAMPHSRAASQPGSRSWDEIHHIRKCRLFDNPLFCMCSLHGLSAQLQSNIFRAQLPCHLPWRLPRKPQPMEMCIPTDQVLTSVKAVLAQDDLSSLRALSPSDTVKSR